MQLLLHLIRKCSRSTHPRRSSGHWSSRRRRSHQPAQLRHIESASRRGFPCELDPHLQVILLHLELGNTVRLQKFDQLAKFFQLISVHHHSSRASRSAFSNLQLSIRSRPSTPYSLFPTPSLKARSRPSHSSSKPPRPWPSPAPYLRFAIQTA